MTTNFNNSMKLVRWDYIQATQPEKVEILEKWFHELACHPTKLSIPVLDVNSGIVYATIGLCHVTGLHSRYVSISQYVRESILENIPYGSKGVNVNPENHKDRYGREVFGHYFISVGDVSKEELEALFAVYKKKAQDTKEETHVVNKVDKTEYVSPELQVKMQEYKEIINKLINPFNLNDENAEFENLTTELAKVYSEIEGLKTMFYGCTSISRDDIVSLYNCGNKDYFEFERKMVEILSK